MVDNCDEEIDNCDEEIDEIEIFFPGMPYRFLPKYRF